MRAVRGGTAFGALVGAAVLAGRGAFAVIEHAANVRRRRGGAFPAAWKPGRRRRNRERETPHMNRRQVTIRNRPSRILVIHHIATPLHVKSVMVVHNRVPLKLSGVPG